MCGCGPLKYLLFIFTICEVYVGHIRNAAVAESIDVFNHMFSVTHLQTNSCFIIKCCIVQAASSVDSASLDDSLLGKSG